VRMLERDPRGDRRAAAEGPITIGSGARSSRRRTASGLSRARQAGVMRPGLYPVPSASRPCAGGSSRHRARRWWRGG
jgi:hypothetical protein